jgi:hypothetical protein
MTQTRISRIHTASIIQHPSSVDNSKKHSARKSSNCQAKATARPHHPEDRLRPQGRQAKAVSCHPRYGLFQCLAPLFAYYFIKSLWYVHREFHAYSQHSKLIDEAAGQVVTGHSNTIGRRTGDCHIGMFYTPAFHEAPKLLFDRFESLQNAPYLRLNPRLSRSPIKRPATQDGSPVPSVLIPTPT